jgi:hypothetical protein
VGNQWKVNDIDSIQSMQNVASFFSKMNIKKLVGIFSFLLFALIVNGQSLRVAAFEADVSPPLGSPVAYAPARSIKDSLSARGIVVLSGDKPIVICAVDWIGISNEGQDEWKNALAKAASTTPDRVSVHALHQHDGVCCDFTIEKILTEYGLGGQRFDVPFLHRAIDNVATAVQKAAMEAQEVTHIGFGEARVEKVASNRRILGKDGKVSTIRWSSSRDSISINAPEGLIDPFLKTVSLWNHDKPIVVMNFYATHPQSHYGQGDVTCEFVGIARNERQRTLGVPHIYFTGAAGNVAAGKYNNGSDTTRYILAKRMEDAMEKAWKRTVRNVIRPTDVAWNREEIALPPGNNINEQKLRATLSDTSLNPGDKYSAAEKLAWLQRMQKGHKASVSALRLGKVWLLNLPGESFVEYQLAAQYMRKQDFVCTAAYEEYGPGYIGTKLSYTQGGYETTGLSSGVSPEAEEILLKAIKHVLR